MKVRHVRTGEMWDVPAEEVRAGRGGAWIDARIEERDAAVRKAEAAATDAAIAAQQQAVRLAEMEQLIREQAETIANLQSRNEELSLASPEASAASMALMAATRDAESLRRELLKDMASVNEWRSQFGADVSVVADQVRRRDETRDAEVEERRARAHALMNELRRQQGLPTDDEEAEG